MLPITSQRGTVKAGQLLFAKPERLASELAQQSVETCWLVKVRALVGLPDEASTVYSANYYHYHQQ